MPSPRKWLLGLIAALMCLPAAGCAAKAEQLRRKNDLMMIGLAHHNWWSMHGDGKGPAAVADLQPFLQDSPATFKKLQDGVYVVVWGASLAETIKAGSTTEYVLAYEAAVPEKGGQVVFVDGHVADMTAEAFKTAKKAVEAKKKKED
jgi:prepilin-type processing-associated H-X9-DG protein